VGNTFILAMVVVTGLAFDFTNGFHDSANAVATSIATGALKPRVAVAMSSVLNLVGAFLSLSVAATIASGIVNQSSVTLAVVFAGLAGGIAWNITTWYLGMPSSSSHALIGGVVGAMLVHAGGSAVIWSGVAGKVFIPAIFAPLFALAVAALGTVLAYRITHRSSDVIKKRSFRVGQIGSAAMVSLAHGTNDAQKTMGILTLALIANKTIAPTASTPFGIPLSTTQVCGGSVVGAGVGRRQPVRWSIFRRMAFTWFVTLPAAALVGAGAFYGQNGIGGSAGVVVLFIVLAAFCATVFGLSRRSAVNPDNVNDEWPDKKSETPAVSVAA
jgi:PiT family inorganic phosphate transporter